MKAILQRSGSVHRPQKQNSAPRLQMESRMYVPGGRMLDEWREKFVLSQQEAIEIYSDMHRALAVIGMSDTDGN